MRPLPAAGRPAGFAGAIGSGLTLERQRRSRRPPAWVRALAVELRLTGAGQHRALAAIPTCGGRRACAPISSEWTSRCGRPRAGSAEPRPSAISWCRIPPGRSRCPRVHYAYFDLAADRYARARRGPDVGAGGGAWGVRRGRRAAARPRRAATGPALAWTVAHAIPDWAWIVLLAAPARSLASARGRLPARAAPPSQAPGLRRSDLRSAEAALDAAGPESWRPIRTVASAPALAAAVRAAGADAELAARVSRRSRAAAGAALRTGDAAAADDAALAAEAQEVVRRLGGSLRGWRARGALCSPCSRSRSPDGLAAQNPAPEQLYESGALRAAAEGFARRAGCRARRGGALVQPGRRRTTGSGAPGRAEAAWLRARRLDPRQPSVRRALRAHAAARRRVGAVDLVAPGDARGAAARGRARLDRRAGSAGRCGPRHRGIAGWSCSSSPAVAVGGGLALRAWYRRPLGDRARSGHPSALAARPRARAGPGRERQRGAHRRTRDRAGCWCAPPGTARGGCPDAAVAADRRIDSRHVPPHRHPARRRRRPDRRRRSRRAPRFRGEGAGRERARRRGASRARRAGERRQDADRR